ncbi:MAG: transporter substrate-binding domain-containing protein [Desulfovibrionaceae bacterium]
MMLKKIRVLLGLLLLTASVAHAGPATKAETGHSVMAQAVERGVLRVGMSSFVPWAMQDKTGAYIGFEVDVATRLAKDFGLKLELVPTRWSGIIPALLTGKFDMIVGGLSITPERCLKVNFSIPYDYTGIEAIAHKASAGKRSTLENFNEPGVVVAVRTGSTPVLVAKKMFPQATLRQFDDEAPAVQEVLSGRAQLFLTSVPLGTFEVLRSPDKVFRPTDTLLMPQPIAIAVRKGDYDSINTLDSWIRTVEAEGWLKERKAYWFESRAWEARLE